MSESATPYRGGCHCGAIGYVFHTQIAPQAWTVRACQCGFCRAHAVVTTSDPAGAVEFSVRDPNALNRYRFGLHAADFLICRNCGVYIGAVLDGARGRFGIVNLHALHERIAGLAAPAPRNYDGESAGERIARRERQWTPVLGIGP
jgi:hypothetical protein